MSELKINEFRERAQGAVAAPDPDLLLQRGRALRRRRQLVPLAALAACAAIGIGLLAPGGGNPRTDQPPANQPSVTETPGTGSTFTVDVNGDARADATAELAGGRWETVWEPGAAYAYIADYFGAVSWGFQQYVDIGVDPCQPEQHATSMSGAIAQLSQVPGTVTRAPRPVAKLGLTGTYLQLSIPVTVECPNGAAGQDTLMTASRGSPKDPTVTVDVWLLEDGDWLLILTRGVQGNPPAERLENLDLTMDTLQYNRVT